MKASNSWFCCALYFVGFTLVISILITCMCTLSIGDNRYSSKDFPSLVSLKMLPSMGGLDEVTSDLAPGWVKALSLLLPNHVAVHDRKNYILSQLEFSHYFIHSTPHKPTGRSGQSENQHVFKEFNMSSGQKHFLTGQQSLFECKHFCVVHLGDFRPANHSS